MNRYLNFAFSSAAVALLATAVLSAQAKPPAPGGAQTTKPAAPAGGQTAKPAPSRGTQTSKPGMSQMGTTVTNLGSIRLTRAVKADGQALPAGTYQVRVTETPASPPAAGQTPQYERWAEFLQGGQVRGREVVTIVPASDISQVAEARPPAPGGQRIEVLKGGDYLRLWLNRGGNHYLIHFNI
jgi:hypothetical protein